MLRERISGGLSTILTRRLVPGLDSPPQNSLYVRPFGYISQDITPGKTEPLRFLQRDHAEDG